MRSIRSLLLVSVFGLTASYALAQQTPAPAPAPADKTAPAANPPAATPAQPAAPADPSAADTQGNGDLSIDEIPDIKVEELTPDIAKKAIDGFVMQHEKFQDGPMSNYDTPEDYVTKDPKGKDFETAIKGLGFASVTDWVTAVMSVTVAYNNILDDQAPDIRQQVDEIKARKDLTQPQIDDAVRKLQAQIPSEGNLKVVNDLLKDKDYSDKVKLFESSEE